MRGKALQRCTLQDLCTHKIFLKQHYTMQKQITYEQLVTHKYIANTDHFTEASIKKKINSIQGSQRAAYLVSHAQQLIARLIIWALPHNSSPSEHNKKNVINIQLIPNHNKYSESSLERGSFKEHLPAQYCAPITKWD